MIAPFLTGSGEPPLDTATAVDRNLELAGLIAGALLDDPTLLERMPQGATLVPIPDDDPALRQHNLNAALDAFASGRDVYLVHVTIGRGPADVHPRPKRVAG